MQSAYSGVNLVHLYYKDLHYIVLPFASAPHFYFQTFFPDNSPMV